MKNKNWAKLLTIATSLILCIVSTFGLTLAFFGGNASANLSTITLKTGIEIGAAIKSSVGEAKVVPGQPVKIEATGTLKVTDKGTPTAANAVDGVVRAKLTVGDELGDVTISGEGDYWTAGGDGYYYLVTEENGTTLRVVKVGDSVKLFGNLVVNKNFTNADSGKSVEASVIFETIQAGVYDSVNGGLVEMTIANATASASPLYASFKAVEYVAGYNITINATISDTLMAETYPMYVKIGDNDPVLITETMSFTQRGTSVTFAPYIISTYAPDHFVDEPTSNPAPDILEDYYIYDQVTGEILFTITNADNDSSISSSPQTIQVTKDTVFNIEV